MLKAARIVTLLISSATSHAICFAESVETQSNPVANGTIHVAAEDADRSDWDGIPWYEIDDDFVDFYPVDIDRVQMAHDANHLYIHIQALEWDVEETWRIGTYIDTDRDVTTGYTGNFLPVGADHFLEDALAFSFNAPSQADWGWTETGEVARDQSSMLDVELAVPLSALGNPREFDFILFSNNFCCDFQMPDDIYPNGPGDVFTYEVSEVALPGDCNGDGMLDAADLGCLSSVEERDAVLAAIHTLPGDLDGDGQVAFSDFLTLSTNFGTTRMSYADGNIDLAGSIDFADFLIMSENFGQDVATAAAVPEPAGGVLMVLAAVMACTRRHPRASLPTTIASAKSSPSP